MAQLEALGELLANGSLKPAEKDPAISARWFADAGRHLDGAVAIADIDPPGAIMLAYESARMSIAAILLDDGFTVRARAGSHQVLDRYASDLAIRTGQPALTRLDGLRRLRSQSDFRPDLQELQAESRGPQRSRALDAIGTARLIHQACLEAR